MFPPHWLDARALLALPSLVTVGLLLKPQFSKAFKHVPKSKSIELSTQAHARSGLKSTGVKFSVCFGAFLNRGVSEGR